MGRAEPGMEGIQRDVQMDQRYPRFAALCDSLGNRSAGRMEQSQLAGKRHCGPSCPRGQSGPFPAGVCGAGTLIVCPARARGNGDDFPETSPLSIDVGDRYYGLDYKGGEMKPAAMTGHWSPHTRASTGRAAVLK
jgi:hypothetical protein